MRKLLYILFTSAFLSYAQPNSSSVQGLEEQLNEDTEDIVNALMDAPSFLYTTIELKTNENKDTTIVYDVRVDLTHEPRLKLTAKNESITHTFFCGGDTYHLDYNGEYDEYTETLNSKTTTEKFSEITPKRYSEIIKIAQPIFKATSENLGN